jgi:hypothetical protein
VITVDESIALRKGRGMPKLIVFPRQMTPVGRESHTSADVDTGVILWWEMWEEKLRMGSKEYITEWGK